MKKKKIILGIVGSFFVVILCLAFYIVMNFKTVTNPDEIQENGTGLLIMDEEDTKNLSDDQKKKMGIESTD